MKGMGSKSPPQRLVDYVCLVGSSSSSRQVQTEDEAEVAQLLRRFPPEDHPDFPLPSNIASFCQPEGHFRTTTLPTSASSDIPHAAVSTASEAATISETLTSISPSEVTTFVFTLTDKDSNVTRYAVCHNFYRYRKTSVFKKSFIY